MSVLVASVTAVFAGDAASPEDVAAALLAHDDVGTVRIGPHGRPSTFRVDVSGAHADAADRAAALAGSVAAQLGLEAEVVAVGLVTDDERVEVFRVGERGDDLVWGER